jgi:transposase
MIKYSIPDDVFQKIYDFLRTIKGIHTKSKEKIRIFVEAIYFLSRSGCQVRLLPKEYGNCFSVYQKFLYWKKLEIWEAMFKHFQNADQKYFMADGTVIRANQCAAGYKKGSEEDLGRSCGGFSTKIHALVDALGNPVKFLLSPGNDNDITHAEELTKELKNTKLLADKGYDSKDFVNYLKKKAARLSSLRAQIPKKSEKLTKTFIRRDILSKISSVR